MDLKITELKIIALNVNSIIRNKRKINLKLFIEKKNPDILLLSETKLNAQHKIQFIGYNTIRTDRPNSKQGGGTAIIIKNNIPHNTIFYKSRTQTPPLRQQ